MHSHAWMDGYPGLRRPLIAVLPRRVQILLGAEWLRHCPDVECQAIALGVINYALGRPYAIKRHSGDDRFSFGVERLNEAIDAADPSEAISDLAFRVTMGAAEWAVVRRLYEAALGPTFAPEWRTSTVVALVRSMVETHDLSSSPILADALQDVGCDDERILTHLQAGPWSLADWTIWNVMNLGD